MIIHLDLGIQRHSRLISHHYYFLSSSSSPILRVLLDSFVAWKGVLRLNKFLKWRVWMIYSLQPIISTLTGEILR